MKIKPSKIIMFGLIVIGGLLLNKAWAEPTIYAFKITVTSELPMANMPMDPEIDFRALIKKNGLFHFFSHAALTMDKRPDFTFGPVMAVSP